MPTISSTSQQLRWLCACYFFFFSILGTMIPYLGVFFENRGFNPQEIGFFTRDFNGDPYRGTQCVG